MPVAMYSLFGADYAEVELAAPQGGVGNAVAFGVPLQRACVAGAPVQVFQALTEPFGHEPTLRLTGAGRAVGLQLFAREITAAGPDKGACVIDLVSKCGCKRAKIRFDLKEGGTQWLVRRTAREEVGADGRG